MKKLRVLSLFLLMMLVVLIPWKDASASSRYYEVSRFNLTVDIQENGDARVLEEITYNFDGEFNGVFRNIDYSRTDGLSDLTVGVLESGSVRSFTEAYSGDANTYEMEDTGSFRNLKIYEKSRNEEKTVVIGYTNDHMIFHQQEMMI